MQARQPTPFRINLDDPASIKVVIAYDTIETAKRAECVYERLTERLGTAFSFEQRLWRFDVLTEETLRAEAARDAAEADIVIVAMNDDGELPQPVQTWLELSLEQQTGAAALVALLQHSGSPVQPYLEDVARRGGMDFFAQSELDARSPDETQLSLFHAPANARPRWLANN